MKVIDAINKKFGENSAILLGEESSNLVPVIPTGSFRLDEALGVGGIPRGRTVEIFGPEGAGKTTLCQHIIANAQKMGNLCAFVDMEHALDPYWLTVCDVDINSLYVSQPDNGEQALDIVELYVRSKEIDVIIVDSVAALVPRAEIEGEMGDSHMALQARLMSQAMRKLTGVVKDSNVVLIFTNQLRQKIGVAWGNPETTTGGEALKFYASVRIDLRKIAPVKEREETIGNEIKATIKKNKVAPPYKIANFRIYFESGIDLVGELIDYSVDMGIIDKRGAFYSQGEERLGQGLQNTRIFLMEHPEILRDLENRVRMQLGLPLRG